MPRLWDETIETHRQAVRRAIMDAAWSLAVDDDQHVTAHLEGLATLGEGPGAPVDRLAGMLEAYGSIVHRRRRHEAELATMLHRPEEFPGPQQQLQHRFRRVLSAAADAGEVRTDIAVSELARYCCDALGAAAGATTEQSVLTRSSSSSPASAPRDGREGEGLVTYVIAEPCIDVTDRSCVEECPVDCIYEGSRMLYIQPDECVDCGACEPVCPVEAIFYEDDVPEPWSRFTRINVEFFDELGAPGGAARVGVVGHDHPEVAATPPSA